MDIAKLLPAIVVTSLMATPSASREQYTDRPWASGLLSFCGPEYADYSTGFCVGYLNGIVGALATSTPPAICLAADFNFDKVRWLVIRHIRTMDDQRQPALPIITKLLRESYPCR